MKPNRHAPYYKTKLFLRLAMAGVGAVLSLASLAPAQSFSGGETMKEPMGARQAGMGEAFAALSGDVNSLSYNAAGLADLPAPVISSMYVANMFEDKNAQIIFGLPVSWLGPGALAGSLMSLMGAEMEINNLDGTSETKISQSDLVSSLGYGIRLSNQTFVGLGVKLYRSTLVEEYTALAWAGDAGLLIKPQDLPGIGLGIALQNLGSEVKYLDQGDPLPSTLRIGASYQHVISNAYHLTLAADLLFPNDSDPRCNLGLEYGWQNTLFIRAGYKLGYDLGLLSVGLGLDLYGFQLDYAFTGMEVGNSLHRFSLTFVFDQSRPVAP